MKILRKIEIEGNLNLVRGTHKESTGNIVVSDEKIEYFSLKTRKKARKLLLLLLFFNIVLEILATKKTRKRNKRHADWKGRGKLF